MTKGELDIVMRRLDDICKKQTHFGEVEATVKMAKEAIGRLAALIKPEVGNEREASDKRVFALYQWIKEHTEMHERQHKQTTEALSAVTALMNKLRDLDPAAAHQEAARDLAQARCLIDKLNKGFEAWQRETGLREDWFS